MLLSRATRALWRRSPRENLRRLTRKAQTVPVWADGKHKQWNRLPYYLTLFEKLCGQSGNLLSFAGKHVLEIGSGPALGLAAFAIVEGAVSVGLVEPSWREIRASADFRNDYLYPLWASHSVLVEPKLRLDFERFLARVSDVAIFDSTVEELPIQTNRYDVITSKSCLEHIADLARALDVCHRIGTVGSIHVHYVDFTMHRQEDRIGSPFGLTYSRSRSDNPEYLQNQNGIVNLLRASEMRRLFEQRFRQTHVFPLVDYNGRLELDRVHADWAGFDHADLTVANAVIVAIK